MIRRVLCLGLVMWPLAAAAETLYVIDRLIIGLRSDLTESATVVKSVETGTALEVLERHDDRARVRDPQGAEGWIDARYLGAQPPTRDQVAELQAEIKRLRVEAARPAAKPDAGPKLAQLETELAQVNAKLAQSEVELEQARATLAEARRAPKQQRPAEAPAAGGSTVLWLAIGFAMLGIGFLAGIVWVRESIRRRMGGMYLRM